MAIKRCPYCKSFIEEKDKYCKNCGTQLLFPEDEFIDEQIPGEKIIEDDRVRGDQDEEELKEEGDEKEDEEDESKDEEEEAGAEEDEDDDEEDEEGECLAGDDEEEDVTGETPQGEKEEDTTRLVDRDTTTSLIEAEKRAALVEAELEEADEEAPRLEETRHEGEEAPAQAEPPATGPAPGPRLEESLENEVRSVQQELRYKTEDLDKMTQTVDEAKREIEEFLSTLKPNNAVKGHEAAEPDPGEIPPPAQVMEKIPSKSPTEDEELPPWAEKIKEAPPTGILGGEEKVKKPFQTDDFTAGIREAVEQKGWTADSGIGIPERIATQPTLPFGEAEKEAGREESGMKRPSPETAQEVEMEEVEEATAEEQDAYGTGSFEDQEDRPREPGEGEADISEFPPSSPLVIALRSKALDVLIVFALWMASIGLAARFLRTTLFKLILSSTVQVLAVFIILLACYFFLFLFFLGETLGDRFLSRRD